MAKAERAWAGLRILTRLSQEGPSRGVLCELLDTLAESIGCERIFLFRLRAKGGFHVLAARNRDRENLPRPGERMSHFAVRKMAAAGEPFFVPDARRDRRYRPEEVLQGKKVPISILVLPLRVQGHLRGGIYADQRFRALEMPAKSDVSSQSLLTLLELAVQLRDQRHLLRKQRMAARQPGGGAEPAPLPAPASSPAAESAALALVESAAQPQMFHGLLTANPDLLDTFDTIRNLARSSLPTLIHGETGTGKSLLARAVHECSNRRDRPFVSLSCAALPETLIESELLGHVKGAFTGAEVDHDGLFVQADSGTLFLDEVGDMSPEMQKKILRVLEEGEVRPVGGKSTRTVDVRLVGATKQDLEKLVRSGRFRRDLYYRMKGVVLEIPPLRERREDVLPLAESFLRLHAQAEGGKQPVLSSAAKVRLLRYGWPGNVRELENEMRRLVALGRQTVATEDLQLAERGKVHRVASLAEGGSETLEEVVHLAEKEAILAALRRCGGNKSKAAQDLGITRKALYRRLAKYGISLPGQR